MSKPETTDGSPGHMCAEGFRLTDSDDYLRMLCLRIEAFTKQKNTNDWANVWQAYIDCQLFLRRRELEKETHDVRI